MKERKKSFLFSVLFLSAVSVAACSPSSPTAWQDDPAGAWTDYSARLDRDEPTPHLSDVGAWVIARGAAIEAGADSGQGSASAADHARWVDGLPCWSADDAAAYEIEGMTCDA